MDIEDRFIPNYYRVESFLRVSRMTVRQALSRLVFEGLVVQQEEAKIREAGLGAPVPVQYRKSIYRGGRFEMAVEFAATPPAP